jgi:uncharacterized protein
MIKATHRLLSGLLILVVTLALLPAQFSTTAAATELFFSEYIEGTSNNKALEIYNGTGAVVDLAAGGYSLQMFFNGSSSAGLTIALTGTVADGDVYVVAHSSASTAILAQADQTNGSGWFNGDDAVALRKGDVILDVIGQIGFDPGTEWGSGLTSTADNTLRRVATICAGDPDGSDPFDPALEWDGFATDTFEGLGVHSAECGAGHTNLRINEFVANHVGTDTHEYIEVFGEPDTDYSGYSIIQIEGDGTGAGVIDSIHPVGTTDTAGFWVTAFMGDVLENGAISLLLVEGLSGMVGDDLDTDNDGVFENTPWSRLVDDVAVSDGGTGDRAYSTTVLAAGFGGSPFTPGGASRIPDGADTDSVSDWTLNDFDLAGIPGFAGSPDPGQALNTPGAPNVWVPVELTSVVVSQVYGGGGNSGATYTHDFIELFNRSTNTVSLDGWSVQYASATGTSWQGTALSGTLQPGQYYLVQEAPGAGGTEPLPTPDAVGSIAMSATNGKVALVNNSDPLSGICPLGGPVVDFVGYGSANCFEGSGAAPELSNTTAALRLDEGAQDTDNNATDFVAGAPSPRNSSFGFDDAPFVVSTSPASDEMNVPAGAFITITFSEAVDVSGDWFNITCTTSGPVPASTSGGPLSFTLDPANDLAEAENCTVTVFANQVNDQDLIDPPDHMEADYAFSFSTPGFDFCALDYTPIYEVQGTGPISPLVGLEVAVQGVVVGDFQNNGSPDNGDLNGFHIQDPVGDGNPASSDGIFIFAPGGMDVAVGDAVRVRGPVSEFNGMTEITASQIWICSTGNSIQPTVISLPVESVEDFEAFEGMLVTFTQPLVISEYFNFDRFGEIVLTSRRHSTPTAIFEPGSPEQQQAARDYLLDSITLDDGRSSQNPDPAIHPNGNVFDLTNLFRGGDTVQNVTGVMDYSFNLYRIHPTQGADYTNSNPRPAQPDEVGGSLKVASFNVLNYFTTIDAGASICGPAGNQECRGADTAEEFIRQRDKIIAALTAIDADIIGLIEIENHPADVPVNDLVEGLNDAIGSSAYDYVATGAIGTDAIRQAFIYKPATVSPVGDSAILDSTVDARFLDTFNRPVLAQTFMDNVTGGVVTVAVNHLKSKGSDCNTIGDPDLGDGAGNCNLTRKLAAEALVDWLASDPTGSGWNDVLIIGDLNSYDKEDPIEVLLASGYTDLIYQYLGEEAYSYVFDGQTGYLDYALASADLVGKVTGTAIWHINADEPDLIDYDMSFKQDAQDALYAPDPYRSSDHDPVIVGMAICEVTAPTLAVSVTPDVLWPADHEYVEVQATVIASDNFDPHPTITLVSVTSNEPDNGEDDGNTINDIVILDDFNFLLRAERSGTGTGRVYTITYLATDACGNETLQSATVSVPLSRGR